MAENAHTSSGHDDGHHGHHIIPLGVLLKVFGALIFLTILTVVLGLWERDGTIHLGALSVPVALGIAGVKATLVAMFFMALKYDTRVNALAFSLSIVFLVVFFVFTFLDTGFRDTFNEWPDTPIDERELQELRLQERNEALQPAFEAQPLVLPGDTALIRTP